jgi:hypothetical protein
MVHDARDAGLEVWLHDRRPPRHAKPRQARWSGADPRHSPTPVADPDALNPYERLMYEHAPASSNEELRHRVFDWAMAGFGYQEASRWLSAGAMGHQAELCARFKRARLSPDLAFRPVFHLGRSTGKTFFDLVAEGTLSVDGVRKILDESARESV